MVGLGLGYGVKRMQYKLFGTHQASYPIRRLNDLRVQLERCSRLVAAAPQIIQ